MIDPLAPLNPAASAHTLQGFIELVFCQVANSVLVDSLSSLEKALSVTKNSIDTLTQLQTLHNYVVVKPKSTFNFNYQRGGTPTEYTKAYQSAASAFFGSPVHVSVSFPGGGFSAYQTQIRALHAQLSSEISALMSITPTLSNGVEDPNSLLAKLRRVMNDLETANASTLTGAFKWITDNYNSVANSGAASGGQIQQNLTNAITAGQALNTTQTESVRNYLYLFEQFYKTASACLQQISKLIQTMAQHIAS